LVARAGWVERSETHHNMSYNFEMKFWRHGFDALALGVTAS